MTRLKALRDLRSAVEKDDPLKTWRIPLSADLIEAALADDVEHWSNFEGAYSGSLTDAIALAEGMLPDVYWDIKNYAITEHYSVLIHGIALKFAPTPARAMLLAVLDARIQKETEND